MKKYKSISDLKLLNESVLEGSLAGFWDWNILKNEEYLSPRFKEMFGYDDHEMENKPESWQKIAFQEDLPEMFENFNKHVSSAGKIPFKSIVRYHHKNGKTVWVRCNGKVIEWGENGEPIRAVGCHIDITEEKELELKLKNALTEREVLLKEVHHRVKNNLQLLLSISKLKDKNGTIETHEIEDSIKSIAKAYEAIYQNENLNKISFNNYLQQIVEPISDRHNVPCKIKSIDLKKNIDFLIPIGLIVTELFNNTLKHGVIENHQISVEIKARKEEDNLILEYRDNGKGYGEKLNQNKEFYSFGLKIIEGLALQLSGNIKLFNDQGACASLKIPLI